jgi:undecaprenyl-diphosphatase
MSIIEAIILGLVQGLTEFLPVSSSGHLVILHHALGLKEAELAFDVALHLGTLIALIAYFRKDLWQFTKGIFKKNDQTRTAWLLIMATIPAAIAGFLLESSAESTFRSVRLVGVTMLIFGLIMLMAERYYNGRESHTKFEKISRTQALIMGFAQAIALVPGVSRSGSTITSGLFAGLDRVAATRFSFLLGIPITAGAILKVFTQSSVLEQARSDQAVFIIGILTALLSGLFAIRFMLRYLANHGLQVFAYYRIASGLIILAAFSIR